MGAGESKTHSYRNGTTEHIRGLYMRATWGLHRGYIR